MRLMSLTAESESPPASWPSEERKGRMIRLAAFQLQQLGVSRHLLPELVCYDLDMVEQQLIWLPARNARKKAFDDRGSYSQQLRETSELRRMMRSDTRSHRF